jgi:hypothetical protein
MLELEIETNRELTLVLPAKSKSIDFPFTVPANIQENGMTFAIESNFDYLSIELFDPDGNILASNSDGTGYFFAKSNVSSRASTNKWGFDKIIKPAAGVWIFRFTRTDDIKRENTKISVSIGLVPKYSAFIKPYKTQVEVGQTSLIELRFSTHGLANNIEGHIVAVFDEQGQIVDNITVSDQLKTLNKTKINSTESTFLAAFQASSPGEYTLKAEFDGLINGQVVSKPAMSKLKVVAPSAKVKSLSLAAQQPNIKNTQRLLEVKVEIYKPIWLVVNLTLSQKGQLIHLTRNQELKKGEVGLFSFEIGEEYLSDLASSPLKIEHIEIIDFDVQADASVLESVIIEHSITNEPLKLSY